MPVLCDIKIHTATFVGITRKYHEKNHFSRPRQHFFDGQDHRPGARGYPSTCFVE
jgi:hypothetical protein